MVIVAWSVLYLLVTALLILVGDAVYLVIPTPRDIARGGRTLVVRKRLCATIAVLSTVVAGVAVFQLMH